MKEVSNSNTEDAGTVLKDGSRGNPGRKSNNWEWHQDYGYWYGSGALYPGFGSCWIAADEATKQNGCLQVIKGSHKLGRLDHGSVNGQTGADAERVELLQAAGLEVVHCELPRGGAVFFHCNTLHSSDNNRSPSPRWGLICCYNTKGNGKLRGTDNHPSYDMALESTKVLNDKAEVALEIWEDSELLKVGQRHWEYLSGRAAL